MFNPIVFYNAVEQGFYNRQGLRFKKPEVV